ncbi:DUF167 family protein YggU [Neptunicella marina]|uniref:UPF0235 protein H8B19_18210 n=1 Tax=Neptunicella marina TaxID=2125989 RepID=A0A8J6J0Z8_9ALTE|nr:DUF167 family protein YggU [Neptunicella marina]MBC3767817.1 YggU family protein [Neptunicella marina]
MSAIVKTADGLLLRLYLQPKASQDKVTGLHGDELKITITAPPVDGKANSHLIKFLAKQFGIAKSQVQLEKGMTSRHKQIIINSPRVIPDWVDEFGGLND